MYKPPPVAVARMRDLGDPRGRTSAITIGESLARHFLRHERELSGLPDPFRAAELCGTQPVERLNTLAESGRVQVSTTGLRILVRASEATRRQRFTVAHEIGHIMMGFPEAHAHAAGEEEIRCDSFARGFLVPGVQLHSRITEALRSGATRAVIGVAHFFDVFPEVVVQRIADNKLLDGTAFILALLRKQSVEWRVERVICDRKRYRYVEASQLSRVAELLVPNGRKGSANGLLEKDVRLSMPTSTRSGASRAFGPAHAVATWTGPSPRAQLLVGLEPALDLHSGSETAARVHSHKQRRFDS